MQIRPYAVLTYSTFRLFSRLLQDGNNQSQESEMQLQSLRVTEAVFTRKPKTHEASRLPCGPNG